MALAAFEGADYKGATTKEAPFVYRLGHQIFILEEGFDSPRAYHFLSLTLHIVSALARLLYFAGAASQTRSWMRREPW